jgi:hypothetical protein
VESIELFHVTDTLNLANTAYFDFSFHTLTNIALLYDEAESVIDGGRKTSHFG